jgi:hypothetical protein
MSVQPVNASKGPQTFEFTKRKRWADLLAAELADVIILILSPAREILYCGNAVTELLGWRVLDLLDHDLLDLIPCASILDESLLCLLISFSTGRPAVLLLCFSALYSHKS